jgi:hypothetical protein
MARLTGKVALITGAAGGQETADAELFVREEAAVVETDIDIAAGEGLARRLTAQGGNVLFRPRTSRALSAVLRSLSTAATLQPAPRICETGCVPITKPAGIERRNQPENAEKISSRAVSWLPLTELGTSTGVLTPAAYQAASWSRTFPAGP